MIYVSSTLDTRASPNGMMLSLVRLLAVSMPSAKRGMISTAPCCSPSSHLNRVLVIRGTTPSTTYEVGTYTCQK